MDFSSKGNKVSSNKLAEPTRLGMPTVNQKKIFDIYGTHTKKKKSKGKTNPLPIRFVATGGEKKKVYSTLSMLSKYAFFLSRIST